MINFSRHDALKFSAGLTLASCRQLLLPGGGNGAADRCTDDRQAHVLVDSASDIFFKPQKVNGVRTEPGRSSDARRSLVATERSDCSRSCTDRSCSAPEDAVGDPAIIHPWYTAHRLDGNPFLIG